MLRILLLTSYTLVLSSLLNPILCQEEKERTGNLTYKLAAANHEFAEMNYRGALLLYREITKANPNNANVLYKTAECHYKLKKYC